MALWKYHHLGVAVSSMEKALAVHAEVFGHRLLSGPFEDPVQRVRVCFVGGEDPRDMVWELVEPLGHGSPVDNVLAKHVAAYHVCYEVDNIEQTLAELRHKGCLALGSPQPAVAFSGRRIAWFRTRTHQLVELLESSP